MLRQGILTITEIAGVSSVDADLNFEKRMRDAATLLALNVGQKPSGAHHYLVYVQLPELTLVRAIMLPVIDSYIQNTPKSLTLTAQMSLKSLLFGKGSELYFNPIAKHYIAEHAHPSLEVGKLRA